MGCTWGTAPRTSHGYVATFAASTPALGPKPQTHARILVSHGRRTRQAQSRSGHRNEGIAAAACERVRPASLRRVRACARHRIVSRWFGCNLSEGGGTFHRAESGQDGKGQQNFGGISAASGAPYGARISISGALPWASGLSHACSRSRLRMLPRHRTPATRNRMASLSWPRPTAPRGGKGQAASRFLGATAVRAAGELVFACGCRTLPPASAG